MPEFTYEAITDAGDRSDGRLTANSEREAMALLDGKGLYPIRVHEVQARTRFTFGKVSGRHMATFYSQLADLLHSGVPLLRSLDILEKQGNQPNLQAAIREVRADVAEGLGLAQAMSKHPKVFNELAVSMVRAGQEGGFLEDVLIRIADFTENQEDLKSKVVGAMAYPVFLSIACCLVLLILMVFFVPRFEPIFEKLRKAEKLPSFTIALMSVSHFTLRWVLFGLFALLVWLASSIRERIWNTSVVWDYGIRGILFGAWVVSVGLRAILKGFIVEGLIIILIVTTVVCVRLFLKSNIGRRLMDHVRLLLPGAGKIFLNLALSRFTRILGTLLQNGIPILRALQIAKDSTGNRVLTEAIEKSAENITAGEKLAAPLGECRYFPRDIVEMVAVAEESNTLETVLIKISNSLEKRTARQLDLFVRLLEPVMLLVMACIIGFVVAGLMLPIFRMGSIVRE